MSNLKQAEIFQIKASPKPEQGSKKKCDWSKIIIILLKYVRKKKKIGINKIVTF